MPLIIMKRFVFVGLGLGLLLPLTQAEINVVVDHNPENRATAEFHFEHVQPPSRNDAATKARFSLLEGEADPASGGLAKLHDGRLPTEADQPRANFFFQAGSAGGRILIDLGDEKEVQRVNTYSWHPDTRGPQVYRLYAEAGGSTNFNASPARGAKLEENGWKLLAQVDTRPKDGESGGQYGVRVSDSAGALGKFRYLLLACAPTETADDFGNTFYSEIDVIAGQAPGGGEAVAEVVKPETVRSEDGRYVVTIDTSDAPDLTEWTHANVAPMAREWYPKLVELLPSQGFEAPREVTIRFLEDMQGVAGTSGTRIQCSAEWFRQNLKGEALGAIFHELVHVVQDYRRGRRENPNAGRAPGWLVEGIADYVRWFKFEPQSHGAEITARNLRRARYDASYRITANFLNWASEKYATNLVPRLNAALRAGEYNDGTWKEISGHTVVELGDEWRQANERRLGVVTTSETNSAAAAPAAGESISLFNGTNFDGWHNFKSDKVRPGWQVKDGVLSCVDPHNAGDLCTDEQFDWFELQLDYKISEGGNSGIMFHVTDQGGAVWATGPEFQLEDNAKAADPIRCGWLYALYKPPIDTATGKPLDATKPVGEWNHVRLLITPEKCEHEINGVKYFDYVLNSDDFKARVAASKFRSMPLFAKSDKGYIALQGDHGQVSFRNIRISIRKGR
jgi:hypothetical protein